MKTPLVFHDRRSSAARVAKCPSAPLPVFFSLFSYQRFLARVLSSEKKHFLLGHSRGYLCSSWETYSTEDERVRKNELTHVLPRRRVRSLGTRRPPTWSVLAKFVCRVLRASSEDSLVLLYILLSLPSVRGNESA